MLVDNYTTDLSDIFDTDLFNPGDFSLDNEYLDINDFPLTQLQVPYFPSSASSSSPSPFLIHNDNLVTNDICIDPQLVDTPSAVTDLPDEDESDQDHQPPSSLKPTITIPPISSSTSISASTKSTTTTSTAHKSRKGTVLSGGIVKKSLLPSTLAKEKENTALALVSSGVAAAKKTAATKHARNASLTSSTSSPSSFGLSTIPEAPKSSFSATLPTPPKRALSEMSPDFDDENDGELPQDWRPTPEILAKMTSKEKRQLRNKISARNFRIRRKEYISTLEGDIAERDRLLDHFRTQLGSRESENIALRQEIATLKKALLQGRGLDPSALSAEGGEDGMMVLEEGGVGGLNLHLPPPKMLPEQSAAEALMLANSSTNPIANNTTTLLTPNTQKDLPTSRVGSSSSNAFWGGVGMGGGITPVHTTLVPDISVVLKRALMENINPSLNQHAQQPHGTRNAQGHGALGGFDGFADAHPFTLKTLDAYRMHLWGKMAAQQSHHNHNSHHHHPQHHGLPSPSSSRTASPSPPGSPSAAAGLGYLYGHGNAGLADRLRPHFFSSNSNAGLGMGMFGKHSAGSSAYPTPPGSPVVAHKSQKGKGEQHHHHQQQQQQQQQALIAAMASQTILKKLGSAFWDAFVGSPSPSSSSSLASPTTVTATSNLNSNASGSGNWDTDKVKRVLEGKAVLRVVDVDSLPSASAVGATSPTTTTTRSSSPSPCEKAVCDLLEESMRSLTIGKKA